MISAREVLPAGAWSATPVDRVVLDRDLRHRRRILIRAESGLEILLDLPRPVVLRHGDGLALDDGTVVLVEAEAENLVEITAGDRASLVRIAWHLGNRHLPTQFLGDRLRIRQDHIVEAMVEGLGGTVVSIKAPFDPEGGAYQGHGHHPG